jgi:hypothetical protein
MKVLITTKIIIITRKSDFVVWIGFIWLRTGTGGELV